MAAYNANADRVLIVDVAAYKYPHTWVKVADLWSAMNTVDGDSGQARGYVVVRAASAR